MIRLYGMGSPNVIKVLIMLEETALDYDTVRIDVVEGEQFEPWFLELNPNAKVPVLIDRRDPEKPTTIFESGAILLYLAETTGVFWPADLAMRYSMIEWLMLQMTGLGPTGGQAIHFNYVKRDDSYGQMRFTNELRRQITLLGDRLAASPYLAGPSYSLADIAFFPWIRTLRDFFADDVNLPQIVDWYDRIATRPAVARACEIASGWSDQDRAAMRAADRPARDRYFGRTPLA